MTKSLGWLWFNEEDDEEEFLKLALKQVLATSFS